MNKKNVLIMAWFSALFSGNFIGSLMALADRAKEENYNTIFMFTTRDDGIRCEWIDYIKKAGYEVLLADPHTPNDEMAQRLLNIIDDYNIDLIYSHFSCFHTVLLWNREIHKKVKICFHDHMDYVAEEPIKPQIKKQIKTAKRYREYGIGVISVMKKKHKAYSRVPLKWYIPNALSYRRNVEYSLSREECRKAIGVKDDEILCLFLGWSIYGKGIDIAIKAIMKVREKNEKVILGILGFGKEPSDTDIARIQDVIGFNPSQAGIRFLDSAEDMFAVHRAADVYLSASRIEAFSYGVLEAISQNVPVVVSDIEGTKWAWKYSKCFRFKSENVEKCAKAIEKALSLRFTSSNYKEIVKKYDLDEWCGKVIEVYNRMLTGR